MQFPNPIVNRLVIFGPDGLPDIRIGPSPQIVFYEGTSPFLALGLFPPVTYPFIKFFDNLGDCEAEIRLFPANGGTQIRYDDNDVGAGCAIGLNDNHIGLTMSGVSWFAELDLVENPLDSTDGAIFVHGTVIAKDPVVAFDTLETWHAVSWQNGWSAFTGSDFPPNVAYRLMPDGTVLFRGIGQAGTKTDNTTLFVLPTQYRPQYKQQFVANTDLARITIRFQVFIDGSVRIFDMAAAPSPALVSLDGIRFPLGKI